MGGSSAGLEPLIQLLDSGVSSCNDCSKKRTLIKAMLLHTSDLAAPRNSGTWMSMPNCCCASQMSCSSLYHVLLLYCMYCIGILYCIVLYCVVLCCVVLCCVVLCCIVLYCVVLACLVLYCIVLYCIVLYCIVLYCIVSYCIVSYRIVLYRILLYCMYM